MMTLELISLLHHSMYSERELVGNISITTLYMQIEDLQLVRKIDHARWKTGVNE